MLEAFGRRLREERLKAFSKQSEFADWGGVKTNSQVNYEAGRTPPTVEYLYRLAEHGVDIGYILTGRRNDGTLSPSMELFLELFDKLSEREREGVFAMVATIAGPPASGLTQADLDTMRERGERHQELFGVVSRAEPPPGRPVD